MLSKSNQFIGNNNIIIRVLNRSIQYYTFIFKFNFYNT